MRWQRPARAGEHMDAGPDAVGRSGHPGPVEQPDVDAARAAADRRAGRQGNDHRGGSRGLRERRIARSFDAPPRAGDPGTYNAFWRDEGKALTRTSLIIDPPDGRVPPYTPEAEARLAADRAERSKRGPADTYTDLSLWTRCISRGWNGIGSWYSSNYQIFQSPGYVVVFQELIHEPRIIPLDGRPHLPQDVDAVAGRFARPLGRQHARRRDDELRSADELPGLARDAAADGALHARRRQRHSTTSSPSTIRRRSRRPWTVSRPMRRQTDGITIFEYACHEGNYAMTGILRGARTEERAAAPTKRR